MRKLPIVAAVAVAGLMFAGPASAKTCKPSVTGQSSSMVLKEAAQAHAIVEWKALATAKYTMQYSNWGNAGSKSVSCRPITVQVGVNMFVCKAKARPCIYQ